MNPLAHEFSPRAAHPPPVSTPERAAVPYDAVQTSPRALFGRKNSIWGSPLPNATRSATMPEKAPWSLDASVSPGLGVNFGGSPIAVNRQRSFTPTTPSPLRQTHNLQTSSFQVHKTYPLMQQEFGTPRQLADQPRVHPSLSSFDATTNFTMKSSDSPFTGTQQSSDWPSPPNQDDRVLTVSTLSPHYLETNPELADAPVPVYRQGNHPQGWRRLISVPGARIEEAFKGAHEIVRGLNPEYFSMPHGTRVVNIKTDHIENMHIAIQRGVWSTLDKVSRRIMVVWNARKYPQEKVLFLFAVNGSKNYCGLAEMSGSYDPDSSVDEWQGNSCVGTIPLTWLYVKNVPYTNVSHITQLHNNQPVVNMWNGMKITSETARKVVEVYIKSPHFTNILAWLAGTGNQLHSRLRTHPSSNNLHNGRVSASHMTGSGAHRSATARATKDWRGYSRKMSNEETGEHQRQDNEVTPTRAPRPSQRALTVTPPAFDRMANSPGRSQSPSIVNMPCVMHPDGSFMVLDNRSSADQPVACRLDRQPQLPPATSQASSEATQGTQALAARHRSRGGLRGGSRTGMAHALRLRGTKSIPTIRESDFERFRNHNSNDPVSSYPGREHERVSTPKPISIPTSHFTFRHELQHARSTDTLVPLNHPNRTHTVPGPSTSIHHGKITPVGFFHDAFTTPSDPPKHAQYSKAQFMENTDSSADYKSMNLLPLQMQNSDNNNVQGSYARAGVHHHTHSPQVMEEWKLRAIVDRGRPSEPTASFYPPSVDKAATISDGSHSLRSDGSKLSLRQQAEYYRILAEKAEYEANMNERLARLGIEGESLMLPHMPGVSSESSSRARTRGSSDIVGSAVETSSIEQYNISPVRNKAGAVLRSASKHGSPANAHPTKAGLRARNAPYQESWDLNVKRTVDQLVTSPPSSSIGNNAHTSPRGTVSSSSDSTYCTSGISGGINLQY